MKGQQMDDETRRAFAETEQVTREAFASLALLMTNVKESLEREIQVLGLQLDASTARMERHAALLQTGSRWSNRMNEWAETIDGILDRTSKALTEQNERISKLEQKNS